MGGVKQRLWSLFLESSQQKQSQSNRNPNSNLHMLFCVQTRLALNIWALFGERKKTDEKNMDVN